MNIQSVWIVLYIVGKSLEGSQLGASPLSEANPTIHNIENIVETL